MLDSRFMKHYNYSATWFRYMHVIVAAPVAAAKNNILWIYSQKLLYLSALFFLLTLFVFLVYLSFSALQVWLDMPWPDNNIVFIAFPVDTTVMRPSITLQLLSHSVKSGEENQHTVPTLPIHSPPLISASLGSTSFFLHPLSLLPFVHLKGVNASAWWNHRAKSLWARHWRSPLLIALSESPTIVPHWVWIWIWMEVASWCWECKVHKWLSLGMDSSATGIVNLSPK